MAQGGHITVYVIEDDPVYLEMVCDFIRDRYKRVTLHPFKSGEEALAAMRPRPDIVILDYFLNRNNPEAMNGLNALVAIAQKAPQARTVILSAQDNIDVSVNMMKYGAYDYIVKNETDVYRLQNILNHLITLFDYDRKIRRTRMMLSLIGVLLVVLVVSLLLRGCS